MNGSEMVEHLTIGSGLAENLTNISGYVVNASTMKAEKPPTWMTVANTVIRTIGFCLGWLPWLALFLVAWKRSLLPTRWSDALFGRERGQLGLQGKLKYPMIMGAMSLYIHLILWISVLPGEVLDWDVFPRFCVEPRTISGFLAIHLACWHHFDFLHFGSNSLGIWILGPLVLSYNRRTFASATFFVGILGNTLVWISAPQDNCYAGFSLVLFGWLGALAAALLLECPPILWKVAALLAAAAFLGVSVHAGLIKDDDSPDVSWHSHGSGFGSGLLYGYLRFGRGWFLCDGLEERVRPPGQDVGVCRVLQALAWECLRGVRESAQDLKAVSRCMPPSYRAQQEHPCEGGASMKTAQAIPAQELPFTKSRAPPPSSWAPMNSESPSTQSDARACAGFQSQPSRAVPCQGDAAAGGGCDSFHAMPWPKSAAAAAVAVAAPGPAPPSAAVTSAAAPGPAPQAMGNPLAEVVD